MNSYYATQTSETDYIRMPMVSSLSPDVALILGALIARNNSNIVELMKSRGELLLGCIIGSLLEGPNVDFGSPESISLSKMLVADVVSLMFQAFETLENSMAAVREEESEENDESPEENDE